MFALIRQIGIREGLLFEGPSLVVAIVVAELFYKFHSFTFECVAFLGTWMVVGYLMRSTSSAVLSFFGRRGRRTP